MSDGQDTQGNSLSMILEPIQSKSKEAVIHCFGFGEDHDSKVLTEIS